MKEIPTKKPVDTIYPVYSVSQVKTYLSCPKKYEYQYVKGISTIKSSSLIFGSSIHSALEHNFSHKILTQQDFTPGVIVDKFAEHMEASKNLVDWEDGYGADIDTGASLLKKYMTDYASHVEPLKVEQKFQITIPKINKEFVGYIDLLDTGYSVIDFKTSKRSPTDQDIRRDLYQLSGYAFGITRAVHELFTEKEQAEVKKLRKIPIRLDYFVKLKSEPKIVVKTTFRDKLDIKRFVLLTQQVITSIQKGVFFPNFQSPLCSEKYCPFWKPCSEELVTDSFYSNDR